MQFGADNTSWPDEAALTHYLAGEADAAERVLVEEWLAQSEDRRVQLERLRDSWQTATAPITTADSADFIKTFQARVGTRSIEPVGTANRGSVDQSPGKLGIAGVFSSRSLPRWVRYSAAGGMASLLALTSFKFRDRISLPSALEPPREYRTARGQVARLQLTDGTHVVLGPASTLRYASTENGRNAELTGVAYFDVVHHPDKLFLVRSGASTTRVLGTGFQVRYYAADTVTTVVVSTGRVMLKGE